VYAVQPDETANQQQDEIGIVGGDMMTTALIDIPNEDPQGEAHQVRTIGPSDARAMLGQNTRNRPMRPTIVDKYASLMTRGRWLFTGEPIIIDHAGAIADGQHRLHAIIAADSPQEILVVTGVNPESRDAIGTAIPRTPADILAMRGEKNATTLASLARYSIIYRHNPHGLWRSGGKSLAPIDLIEELDAHPEYREYARRAESLRRTKVLTAGPWAMAMCILASVDRDAEYLFTGKLATGEMLPSRDPILTLRKRLADIKASLMPVHYDPRDYCALVVRGWNAWRKGETPRVLQIRSRSGEFPRAI
jgi:hypothetical protein